MQESNEGQVDRVVATVVLVYLLAVTLLRFHHAACPWAAEGDARQWLWTAWRQHDPALLPPTGDQLLADYLTGMQPPLYRLLLGGLALVLEPLRAALVLAVAAWGLLLGTIVVGLRRRVGLGAAALAAALVARDLALFEWSTGGYPRSFGPPLVALFLAAWLNGRQRLALAVLLVAAGLYPSVVVPCGLCIGVATVGRGVWGVVDVRAWLRQLAELSATAVGVAGLALSQNLLALPFWGRVVHGDDAGIALTSTGRCEWWPHPDPVKTVLSYLGEPAQGFGHGLYELVPSAVGVAQGWLVAVVAIGVVVIARRAPGRLPWGLLGFVLCALVAYGAARGLAFQLYFPKRMVQHTLPLLAALAPVLVVVVAVDVVGRRHLRVVAVMLLVVMPTLLLAGDGLERSRSFRDRRAMAPLMTWVGKTDVNARFAGDLRLTDWIPLLGPRHVLVNFTLAHPFRLGYFAVVRQRIEAVYDAIYADDAHRVLAFLNDHDVDYLVVDRLAFDEVEQGFGRLFEPMRSVVVETMFLPRRGRFALATPPTGSVVFSDGSVVVIGRDALRTALGGVEANVAGSKPSDAP